MDHRKTILEDSPQSSSVEFLVAWLMFMPYLNDIQRNLKLPSAICVTRHFLRERVQVIQLVATGTIQVVQGRKDLENK